MGFVKWDDVKDQIPTSAEGQVAARSALEAEFTGYMLRELRKKKSMSQAEVAQRMGVSQRRVSAIERGEVSRSEVATLTSYIGALGGVLHVVAEIDGRSVRITSMVDPNSSAPTTQEHQVDLAAH